MKILIATILVISAVAAVPVPQETPKSIELLKIPLKGDKELDILTLGDQDGTLKERNKRTIGVLRELFPNLSKIIEQKIQSIVQVLFRTIGPLLLRGGLGGGAGGGGASGATTSSSFDDDFDDSDEDAASNSGTNGRKVAVSLPTFPPFEDSEEDTKANEAIVSSSTSAFASSSGVESDGPSRISLNLNAADSDKEATTSDSEVNSVR